jgi:phosphoglycolate phosphatase-like HAD superfamily hydrolase
MRLSSMSHSLAVLPERPLLIICDIDGPLINVPDECLYRQRALAQGLWQVTGLQVLITTEEVSTDYERLCSALERVGMKGVLTEESFELIEVAATHYYGRACPQDLRSAVSPGVWSVLTGLRSDGMYVVPCSDALAGIARLLIERAQLQQPLLVGFGGYAAYGVVRSDLMALACEHAGRDLSWPLERTVLVSSCEEDLTAAALAGAHTLAVALSESFAEASVENFEQVPQTLRRWR